MTAQPYRAGETIDQRFDRIESELADLRASGSDAVMAERHRCARLTETFRRFLLERPHGTLDTASMLRCLDLLRDRIEDGSADAKWKWTR